LPTMRQSMVMPQGFGDIVSKHRVSHSCLRRGIPYFVGALSKLCLSRATPLESTRHDA
jgi:hypothetical protein